MSVVLCVLAIVAVAAAIPELALGRFGLAAAPVGDQVIFCGGFLSNTFQPSALCEVLSADDSIRSGQFWTGTQRGYLAAASTNNIALFGGGGVVSLGSCVDTVDGYNATNSSYFEAPALSEGRLLLSAASVSGFIAFAGGINDFGAYSSVVDLYKVKPDRVLYSQTLLLSVERAWMAAASLGKFMVFSGGENIGGVSTAVDIFHFISPLNIVPSTNTLTNPRSRHVAACIQTSTEILYLIAGGVSSMQAPFGSTASLSLDTGTFNDSWHFLAGPSANLTSGYNQDYAVFAGGGAELLSMYTVADGTWQANVTPTTGTFVWQLSAGACAASFCAFGGGADETFNRVNQQIATIRLSPPPTVSSAPPQSSSPPPPSSPPATAPVLAAITVTATTGHSPSSGCLGDPPMSLATCDNGVWSVPGGVIQDLDISAGSGGSPIVIDGPLTMTDTSNVAITLGSLPSSPVMTVTGEIRLAGTLVLNLPETPDNGDEVTVFSGSKNVSGQFSGVLVNAPGCGRVYGKPYASSTTFAVVLSTDCGKKRSLLALYITLPIVFVGLLVLVGLYYYRKVAADSTLFAYHEMTDSTIR